MNDQEVQDLIAEYNRVEAEQTIRLRALYDYLYARKGYRKVEFGPGYSWSNSWDGANQADRYRKFTDSLARPITKFEPGSEG